MSCRRRGGARLRGGAGILHRVAGHPRTRAVGAVQRQHHVAVQHLRIGKRIGQRVELAHRDAGLRQRADRAQAAVRRGGAWLQDARELGFQRGDAFVGVLVVNTHWDHVGRQARAESGRQLARWLQDARRGEDAVIMLGDYNTDSDDPALADMLQLTGLRSAQVAATSTGAGEQPSTFNRFEVQPPAGLVIDHIFVSENVAVRRSMVLAQHLNGRVPSDHFPFAALLGLPSKQRGKGCT